MTGWLVRWSPGSTINSDINSSSGGVAGNYGGLGDEDRYVDDEGVRNERKTDGEKSVRDSL